MSTIEMNSVAGFKAVDAEGNELGIMSMADITAAVKESIMQDAAMARSVATLSEASTLAASDTYEDKLPQQTDLKWARGLDANGNPILISKESLASVVGGLLPVANENNNGLAIKGSFIKITRNITDTYTLEVNGFVLMRKRRDNTTYTLYFASGNKLTKLTESGGINQNLSIKDGYLTVTPNTSPEAVYDIIYCKF